MLALLLVVGLSSPATLASAPGAERPTAPSLDEVGQPLQLAQAIDPTAPDHTPTFLEQYLSLTISPYASREVQDGLVLSHVLGYVAWPLLGGLWGPAVAVKGAQLNGDVAISWLLSSVLWGTGSILTCLITLPIVPYLQTTATLNAIDRDLKKRPAALPKPTAPNAKGGKPPPSEAPPPTYAY